MKFISRHHLPAALLGVALSLLSTVASSADVEHVIQISVDGLRGDTLRELVEAAPEAFPNFVRLKNEGAYTYNARCDYDYSVTVPNHATMVTGRPVAQPAGQPNTTHHGFNTNFPRPGDTLHSRGNTNVSYVCSVFDVAHDHGLSTALYVGKTRLSYIDASYDAANGAPDLVGEDNGTDKIDDAILQNGRTQELIDAITSNLSNAVVNFTFVHITDPDAAGHSSGWISIPWDDATLATDLWLGEIFAAIDANPALAGKVAITLTGDHGGGGSNPYGHTDAAAPENYVIPFFVWAPGIPPGTDLYSLLLNRYNPGEDRPDYDAPRQPIRGGDAANLSLSLLNLPPIPGSFMVPEVNFGGIELQFTSTEETLDLTWPGSPAHLFLEKTDNLAASAWQKVTSGITDSNGIKSYSTPLNETASSFYRLRTAAFSITSQPQSTNAHSGADVTFLVETDTVGLDYQWQFNGINLVGETGNILVLQNVQSSDAGSYAVTVSDGSDTVSSALATLSVLLNPVIAQHPQSLAVGINEDATFTVAASGAGPLSYRWQHNSVDLPGSDTNVIVINNAQPAQEGNYSVVVSDAVGSTLSDPAQLTVLDMPVIVQQPQAKTVNVGDTVTFTVVVTGNPPPFTYRWRRNNLTVDIENSNDRTSTLTITNVQLSHAGRYDVIVTNPANPAPGALSDGSALLTVLEP